MEGCLFFPLAFSTHFFLKPKYWNSMGFQLTLSLCQFHQHFTPSFYMHRSKKHKKTVNSSSFFCFWHLCMEKLPVNYIVDKIDPVCQFHQLFGIKRKWAGRNHLAQKDAIQLHQQNCALLHW